MIWCSIVAMGSALIVSLIAGQFIGVWLGGDNEKRISVIRALVVISGLVLAFNDLSSKGCSSGSTYNENGISGTWYDK
jgi:O-antigen/teichoic acid export membrane protein